MAAPTHDAGPALSPGLPDCSSNSCQVQTELPSKPSRLDALPAALSLSDRRFRGACGFDRRRNPHGLRPFVARAGRRPWPSALAAGGGLWPTKADVLAAAAHGRRQPIHQVRAEEKVIECLDLHISVHLVARLVCTTLLPPPGPLRALKPLRRNRHNWMASGFSAISSGMMSACPADQHRPRRSWWLHPICAANCLISSSMRSNHPIPVRLTAVIILISSSSQLRSPWPREAPTGTQPQA